MLFGMSGRGANRVGWLFGSSTGPDGQIFAGAPHGLIARWLFLRALAAIYFSAFFSLLFQIRGLIGPDGILPARDYLAAIADALGAGRYWYTPSLFWFSSTNAALMTVTWIGLAASIAAFLNLWPRLCFFICFICFLSFVGASSTFSSYQSDGMLLEAGFISLFFAPQGLLPGLGAAHPPSRASIWLLQWEWFRIYFESGLVKLLSGDPQWRNFTAMDEYYQNGPLPTWIGWYAAHLPHGFHAFTVAATLILELGLVFLLFFPRRLRILLFFIVTPWEFAVIFTANYAFLNYLVLALGILLLDDKFLRPFVPALLKPAPVAESVAVAKPDEEAVDETPPPRRIGPADAWSAIGLSITAVLLTLIGYATTAELVGLIARRDLLPQQPVQLLEPFRIANQYGLFAVMTRGRYEIEFQGSNDGENWTAYTFRNKPQALTEAPRIYAPYQPRFDWNLWFASLGSWRQNNIVPITEELLLDNNGEVLALFRSNPFPQAPPRYVRAVLWQYWFTSMQEKRSSGNWWRREYLGIYAPVLTPASNGKFAAVQMPDELPRHD
jgi:hypothetical protein